MLIQAFKFLLVKSLWVELSWPFEKGGKKKKASNLATTVDLSYVWFCQHSYYTVCLCKSQHNRLSLC